MSLAEFFSCAPFWERKTVHLLLEKFGLENTHEAHGLFFFKTILSSKFQGKCLLLQHGDCWIRSVCVLFMFQSCDLHFALFLVDVDSVNCVTPECGLLGFKVETQCL